MSFRIFKSYILIITGFALVATVVVAENGPLARELAEKAAGGKTDDERRQIMQKAIDDLRKSTVMTNAAKVGDSLPEARVVDHKGKEVALKALVKDGPVVLTFYRGGWCPYCNIQLRAYQKSLPEFTKAGGTLVAVSPEKPDETLSTKQKDELTFTVLSDVNNSLAEELGLVFKLPEDLKKLYLSFGIDLEKSQGNADWRLPLAATYIVDREGVIRWRFIDADYKKRAEPADIVVELEKLTKKADKAG